FHDHTARVAEINRHIVLDVTGGMVRAHVGNGEVAEAGGAAGVHRVDLLDALAVEPHAYFEIGGHGGPGGLRDVRGVADVVAVAMGEQDMVHAFYRGGLGR